MIGVNKIIQGDALVELKKLPDEYIDCCVTSPPYYGLRDYGSVGQIGLEESLNEYVENIATIFEQVRRILKKGGTLWLNLGDTYAAYWGQKYGQGQSLSGSRENNGSAPPAKKSPNFSKSKRDVTRYGGGNVPSQENIKPKDLFGVPWAVAFALRSAGWYLRQDIIWHKPNPMPESVTDRCTKSHEYIFLLSKSAKYYYDAFSIATPYLDKTLTTFGCEVKGNGDGSGLIQSENWANSLTIRKPKEWKTPDGWDTSKGSHGTIHKEGREKGKKGYEHRGPGDKKLTGHSGNRDANGNLIGTGKANKRSVWTVTTMPYKEAHFATFPEELIVDCIKAGCPENGIVLDPFMGAGTTALVARKLHRNFIGIELNPEYIKIAEKRLKKELGMFL